MFYEPYWLNPRRASRIWHYAGDRELFRQGGVVCTGRTDVAGVRGDHRHNFWILPRLQSVVTHTCRRAESGVGRTAPAKTGELVSGKVRELPKQMAGRMKTEVKWRRFNGES